MASRGPAQGRRDVPVGGGVAVVAVVSVVPGPPALRPAAPVVAHGPGTAPGVLVDVTSGVGGPAPLRPLGGATLDGTDIETGLYSAPTVLFDSLVSGPPPSTVDPF